MSLDQPAEVVKQQTTTRDAFLGGRLIVSQPRNGFRAGMDSVLLGAAVSPHSTSVLDLGAGVGTAALVALTHSALVLSTLAEMDDATAALAKQNIADNGLNDRANVAVIDVTAPGRDRFAAGIPAEHFDAVIANPPYFEGTRGTAPSAERVSARHMDAAMLDRWLAAAATHAAPGGEAIFIHAAAELPALLAAFGTRFGAITVLPLLPRDGEPAARVLVRGKKGSRAPFTLLQSRALHGPEGRGFRPEFEAIFRGEARLIW